MRGHRWDTSLVSHRPPCQSQEFPHERSPSLLQLWHAAQGLIASQPGDNRIFVSCQAGCITADLTRSGTPGDVLLRPLVVHPLIETIGVAKQRARAKLSALSRW